MSRQKVPDDKRQRTAQACDYCKRRKQKCNGAKPCSTCTRKNVACTFTAPNGNGNRPASVAPLPGSPARKRRRVEKPSHLTVVSSVLPEGQGQSQPNHPQESPAEAKPRVWPGVKLDAADVFDPALLRQRPLSPAHLPTDPTESRESVERVEPAESADNEVVAGSESAETNDPARAGPLSDPDEEAVLLHTTRLLKDATGRLLYIGDSATLSYLHLFRLMVESIVGKSSFTDDPRRKNIVENVVELPAHIQPPSMLADRQTANVLVESFFTNTSGLVEIFDRRDFFAQLDASYANPLSAKNQFLCLLFLTWAIGLVMATPEPGTPEEAVIRRLRGQPYDQAELFFRSAKCLGDPLNGLEDADFWSVQALALMCIYMLAVSKRNAAFVYIGMAVRSAIALGLHRQETMAHYRGSALRARIHVWKSLYVLDRFIAASLGRPVAINEDDCTEAPLKDAFLPHISPIHQRNAGSRVGSANASASASAPACTASSATFQAAEVHMLGVNASVRSSRLVGTILKKLYARRRVSTRATQDIVQQCGMWTRQLHECLRWHRPATALATGAVPRAANPPTTRAHSIAILHANLFYYHSIILLTRPFFLFLIQADRRANSRVTPYLRARTEKFSEVCVTASHHTISLIHAALEGKYLPQRDPFVMYFLFTAALLIMSNELLLIFHNPTYGVSLSHATAVMEYFAINDPQGRRLLWILNALQDVVKTSAGNAVAAGIVSRRFRYHCPDAFVDGALTIIDPIEILFVAPSAHGVWNRHGASGLSTSSTSANAHDAGTGAAASMNSTNSVNGNHLPRRPRPLLLPPQSQRQAPSHHHRPHHPHHHHGSEATEAGHLGAAADSHLSMQPVPSSPGTGTAALGPHTAPALFRTSSHHPAATAEMSPTSDTATPVTFSTAAIGPTFNAQHPTPHPNPAISQQQQQQNYSYPSPPVLPLPYALPTPQSQSHFSPGGMYGNMVIGGVASFGAFRPFLDCKPPSENNDGSDSMGTDGEGFDFDCLWNWPNPAGDDNIANGGTITAASVVDPMAPTAAAGMSMQPISTVDAAAQRPSLSHASPSTASFIGTPAYTHTMPNQTYAIDGGGGIGSSASDHGARPTGGEDNRASRVGGPGSGGMIAAPMNVPLYPTADFS